MNARPVSGNHHWAVTALGGELSRSENEPRGTALELLLPAETGG